MPKIKKEPKTCHDCGLEAIDECEMHEGHVPYNEILPPCVFCTRNTSERNIQVRTDFYREQWTLDAYRSPILEDATPQDVRLLKLLHILINGGERVAV
jgi:hypothetical protein